MATYDRERINELMHSTDPLDRIIFNYGLEDDRGRQLTDELHELFAELRNDAERWRKLSSSHCRGGYLMVCNHNYVVLSNTATDLDAAADAMA